MVIGVFGHETMVKAANIQDRETEVIGSLMYVMRDIKIAIEMLADGKLPADDIITGVYQLDECNEAFTAAHDTKKNIKVLLEVNPE